MLSTIFEKQITLSLENRISKRHRIRVNVCILRHRQTLYQYNRGQLRMHNIVVLYQTDGLYRHDQ